MSDPDPTPEVTQLLVDRSENVTSSLAIYTPEAKVKAYELFLTSNQTPEEISLSVSLPGFMIRHWIGEEGWADRKAKFESQLLKRIELEHQQFVMANKISTAKRHLIASKMLEDEVIWVLESLEKARAGGDEMRRGHDMTLVRLSQALKNATDVSARVVGISDKPPLTEADAARTIIMIGGRPLKDHAARIREVERDQPPEKVITVEALPTQSPSG